jgi:hypothetical protein
MRNIDPSAITVSDLVKHGVEEVQASCQRCAESWHAPIIFLPSTTTLKKIGQLMFCRACGGPDVAVAPAWPGETPKAN